MRRRRGPGATRWKCTSSGRWAACLPATHPSRICSRRSRRHTAAAADSDCSIAAAHVPLAALARCTLDGIPCPSTPQGGAGDSEESDAGAPRPPPHRPGPAGRGGRGGGGGRLGGRQRGRAGGLLAQVRWRAAEAVLSAGSGHSRQGVSIGRSASPSRRPSPLGRHPHPGPPTGPRDAWRLSWQRPWSAILNRWAARPPPPSGQCCAVAAGACRALPPIFTWQPHLSFHPPAAGAGGRCWWRAGPQRSSLLAPPWTARPLASCASSRRRRPRPAHRCQGGAAAGWRARLPRSSPLPSAGRC